jgi:hypothetical protein
MNDVLMLMLSFGTVCGLAGYALGCYVISRTHNTSHE